MQIRMARINDNGIVQVGKSQNLGIDIKGTRIVKCQIQTLLRLQWRHEISAQMLAFSTS
jgi:hypothetical protein